MDGFRAIPELLRRAELGVVFSMLGGTNVPWIAQGVLEGSLRLVKTRHEQTAVGAAGGFARATGSIGLCSVTRGPGFTNAINALVVATHSHVPILLIVGESPTDLHGSAQNVDQLGLTRAVGAGFHHVERPEDLESTFWSAIEALQFDGCPQVLSVRSAILGLDVDLSPRAGRTRRRPSPDADAVRAAVNRLAESARPLILAGSGVVLAGGRDQVVELAALVGARLATTLRTVRLFEGHPADLGLSGGWAPLPVRHVLANADVVVAFGTSLNDFTTAQGQAFPNATLIHAEVDPAHGHMVVRPEIEVVGDARTIAAALVDEWQRRGLAARPAWGAQVDSDAIRAAVRSVDVGHDPRRGLDPREVFITFDDRLPEDRVVVTDTGRFIGTLPSLVAARDAGSWLVGNSFQSVGQGLGAAIGAATAYPDRIVVLFTGDGGFTMSTQDLDAIRLNGLNLTIVIINDEQYGSEIHHLDRHGLPHDVVRQSIPDVDLLARAYGGRGTVVRTADDLARLEIGNGGLHLVDVRVDPVVNVRDVPAAWSRAAAG